MSVALAADGTLNAVPTPCACWSGESPPKRKRMA
jgi:hypothetical protein